jgi:hypothetical protein
LTYIPSIITDDVVGYWPGARTVRGAEQYMQAMEELLGLLPDLNSTYGRCPAASRSKSAVSAKSHGVTFNQAGI